MDIFAASLVVRREIVYFRFCGYRLMLSDGGVVVAVVGLGIRFRDRKCGGMERGRAGEGGGGLYRYCARVQVQSVL